jgi:hypothetical protein
MKIPRDLSGHDLVQALCRNWGYRIIHQEGSPSCWRLKNLLTNAWLCLPTKTFASER